jgi:hypothetical protein
MLGLALSAMLATCMLQTPALAHEVGLRALPWLPPDLARQVARHPRAFTEGYLAAARWPANMHLPEANPGVDAAIALQCERLAQAIRNERPFEEVVAGMGALAHLAVDHAAPFPGANASDADATAFRTYLPTALPRIPLVFYGQQRRLIAGTAAGIPAYLTVQRRAVGPLGALIREDLARVGGPQEWRLLDDRSTTFGAASLVINHAVSDFVNLASWVWSHAGGLVPTIEASKDTLLVWKGDPQPRETPRSYIRFRQTRR